MGSCSVPQRPIKKRRSAYPEESIPNAGLEITSCHQALWCPTPMPGCSVDSPTIIVTLWLAGSQENLGSNSRGLVHHVCTSM